MLHDDCEVVVLIHKELCECGSKEKNLEKAVEEHEEDSEFVRYVMKLADYMNSQTEMLVADEGQLATEIFQKYLDGVTAVMQHLIIFRPGFIQENHHWK